MFCLYSFVLKENLFREHFDFDSKMLNMGSYIGVVNNSEEFIKRVKIALNKKMLVVKSG